MKLSNVFIGLALAGMAGSAFATNGFFSHGYGMKAKGMGGAGTASTEDAFGGANNPASMAYAGNRYDLGADLFSPRRSVTRTGLGPLDGSADSDSNYFLVPEFGMVRQMSNTLALGVTVYGNGGMNTDYPGGQINCGGGAANLLCGSGSLGVDLMQLIVAPTAAYKLTPDHALGVSPLIGFQRFKAEGLQAFTGISQSNTNVTNKGYDEAFGYGVRVGYMGKVASNVTVGAAYASKMRFEEFDKYRGLFAEQGDLDIPSNWNLGISVLATPDLRLALDYQRINYTDVKSVSNSLSANPLGADNGPGFGWRDVDVWKLGVEYRYSTTLLLRAGYNRGDNPIRSSDVTFNIIAPGVVKDHVTLGFTYTLASGNELTMSYMHAFKESVSGASVLPTFPPTNGAPAGNETIEMYQNSLGIQYSWKM